MVSGLERFHCSRYTMALQINNSARNFSAMNPGHFRKNMTKQVESHIVLSQILHCQCKEKEDKGSTMILAV